MNSTQNIVTRELPRVEKPSNLPPTVKVHPESRTTSDNRPEPFRIRQNIEPVETDDEQTLQDLDSRVGLRYVVGKFRGEMQIHGETWIDDSEYVSPDYEYLPKSTKDYISGTKIFVGNDINFDWLFDKIRSEYHGIILALPGGFSSKDMLTMAHSDVKDDSELVNVVMYTPVDGSDLKPRPIHADAVGFRMSRDNFDSLKELIKQNPSNAERWIQICFSGFDRSAWRKPVSRIAVIDCDTYFPKRARRIGYDYSPDEYNKDAVKYYPYPDGKKLPNVIGALRE